MESRNFQNTYIRDQLNKYAYNEISILQRILTYLLPTRTTRFGSESRVGFSHSASWVMRSRLNTSLLILASWWSRVPHNDNDISGTAVALLLQQHTAWQSIHNWLLCQICLVRPCSNSRILTTLLYYRLSWGFPSLLQSSPWYPARPSVCLLQLPSHCELPQLGLGQSPGLLRYWWNLSSQQ